MNTGESPQHDFKVAIDFGTTFTTIAFVKQRSSEDQLRILTVENFPKDPAPSQLGKQVPTESWYPIRPGKICQGYLHGYEVYEQCRIPDSRVQYPSNSRVARMKLLLDNSPLTRKLRSGLEGTLQELKDNNLIKKDEDVIRDFLTVLLLHTRSELERKHGLTPKSKVEIVICVPICWNTQANGTMCNLVTDAMQKAGFAVTNSGRVSNLFMVNEAEAAATYALSAGHHDIRKRNETFILLDCGGGTVDAGTYTVANAEPLRLEREVVNPTGALCGSSYLNERMRDLAWERLRDEKYLDSTDDGVTLQTIISGIMDRFENPLKKGVDFKDNKAEYSFYIQGLKANSKKPYLRKNRLVLNHQDMLQIFEPCFLGIQELLEGQIRGARELGIDVDKVVLVGGFADSPSLFTFLRWKLGQISACHGTSIQLICAPPNTCATGVAIGALLRALNKKNGPKRIPHMSYGILRHIPYQPEAVEEHPYLAPILEGKVVFDKVDGRYYVDNTIFWIIKASKGSKDAAPLASTHRTTFQSIHTFPRHKKKWIAKEVLFASETCTEDYYERTHPKNRGKTTQIGKIVLDLTHLKEHIMPKIPADPTRGMEHYEVTVMVEMEVIDRDLKFNVRWPADDSGEIIEGSQKSFSIAAAFEPGTN
ncbi:hypothetical protein K469DRAFT_731829 [Zopfia rhizophila CBS 207.26]|uniref:Actin-like ATPase domain-containing protein n=1 Tax=Zopfia rhizophila CBS 207.26 TaxID=1314779 RepID=A0A6A6DJG0_9PEZI|nr:hypothetical protein K469DRAFT_731829 [Zopfia rhizophila CBS 207.26]